MAGPNLELLVVDAALLAGQRGANRSLVVGHREDISPALLVSGPLFLWV